MDFFSFLNHFVVRQSLESHFHSALIAFVLPTIMILYISRIYILKAWHGGVRGWICAIFIPLYSLVSAQYNDALHFHALPYSYDAAAFNPCRAERRCNPHAALLHTLAPPGLRLCGSRYLFFFSRSSFGFAQTPVPLSVPVDSALFSSVAPGGHGGKQIFTKQSRVNLISACALPGGLELGPLGSVKR